MSQKKIIAVLGATGAQGGGVIRGIQADTSGQFIARAVTRNATSDKAKALADQGIEVVAAELDDEASLARAFAGAHGAFIVTNFWEHFSPAKETAQGGNAARACKTAGVKHAVWSTFEDTRHFVPLSDDRMPTLQGAYKVPHFDAKADADHFFEGAGVPTTRLLTSFYWDNLIHFGMGPKKGADGRYGFTLPMADKKLPGIAAEDIGRCAFGIFARGDEFVGKAVGVAGEHLTGAQMAASLSKALSVPVDYHGVPAAVYRSFGFPGADDLGNMFQFKAEFEETYCGARDVSLCQALYPGLLSFDAWLAKYGGQIAVG